MQNDRMLLESNLAIRIKSLKKIFILEITPKEITINSEKKKIKKALHTTTFFTAIFITWTIGDDLNVHRKKNGCEYPFKGIFAGRGFIIIRKIPTLHVEHNQDAKLHMASSSDGAREPRGVPFFWHLLLQPPSAPSKSL